MKRNRDFGWTKRYIDLWLPHCQCYYPSSILPVRIAYTLWPTRGALLLFICRPAAPSCAATAFLGMLLGFPISNIISRTRRRINSPFGASAFSSLRSRASRRVSFFTPLCANQPQKRRKLKIVERVWFFRRENYAKLIRTCEFRTNYERILNNFLKISIKFGVFVFGSASPRVVIPSFI